jgi:hypothetical protein
MELVYLGSMCTAVLNDPNPAPPPQPPRIWTHRRGRYWYGTTSLCDPLIVSGNIQCSGPSGIQDT